MGKSEKLIKSIVCSMRGTKEEFTLEERVYIIEKLLQNLIDNDIAHIWLLIKIILAGIFSILAGLLVKYITG